MPHYNIRKHAEEMGVMVQAAAAMRIRFLVDEVGAYADIGDDVAMEYAFRAIDEIIALKPIAKDRPKKSNITPEMIDRARQHPIDKVIEFSRGVATAWCHDDKRPSLYHAKRTNTACCPVCNKYFDSIAVLMQRDGYTFTRAVEALQ